MKIKISLFFCIYCMLNSVYTFAQVGIGTKTPASSAALEVSSINNDKGILIPRITAAQKNAIEKPVDGLLIYQTTAPIGFYYYTAGAWILIINQTDLDNKIAISTAGIIDGSISTNKLAEYSVTDSKIAPGISKSKVGLENVNNTADADKQISNATQTALNLKLNTNDIQNYLDTKVDKISGKSLSTNDYTTAEKTKLAAISGSNTGDQDLSAYATLSALSLKSNTADVATSLALKANLSDVTTALDAKESLNNKTLNVSTDGASDDKYPSVKAVKTYVDASIAGSASPLSFTAPLSKSGNTISVSQANGSVNGYLSSSDWTSFTNKIDASQKAANNGVATLGSDGKVPSNQIPAISFQSANVVSSESAMLGLSNAVVGSIAIRTDENKNYVLSAIPATTINNWIVLATPTSITSVNGSAGPNIVLTSNDVAEGVTNKYYTDTRTRSALSASAPLVFNNGTGAFSIAQASTTADGFLTAADWNTFKNKQNALTAGVDYVKPNGNVATATNAGNITATSNTTLNSLANLNTVGTITSGVWNGTTLAISNGGTGSTTATAALSNLGAEAVSNKSTDSNLGNTNPSDDFYPSQKAVKNYVDMQSSNSGIADVSISNAKLAGSITATKLVGTDISTVGTITAGRWNGTAIDIAHGGTGATNAADARSNLGLVIGTTVLAPNSSITAGSKTKITYDTKGLVTAGADATTADIAASTNKNYVTDVQAGVLSNTSGTNTGDETASTIKTKLGITTLSGNNTGDQTITLTGDVSGSGTGSFASTVNSVGGVSSATIATLPTSLASNTTNIISNTSDIATINTALVTKAPLASPAFTGTPTAPTPTTSDNSTKIATTEYVKASITASSAGLSSVGAISETSNAKGATISSGTSELILTPADATNGGILTNGTQSIAGYKTFESHINVKGEIRSAGTVAIRSGGSGPTWVGVGIGTGKGGTGLSNPGAAGNILTSNGTFWTTSAPAAVNAGTLTGSTLASNITSSSLTTLGTITSGTWNGTAIGSNVGGAGTVNGLMKANGTGVVSTAVAGTDYQAPLTTTQVGVLSNTSGTNTGDQTITLTGDVSGTGTGSFASTVNSVGGVSSAIIATLPTSIASNTTNIISNTSDIATINTALATKAPLASPSFTGTPTAPTPTTSDNSTQLATTAFVKANIGTASAETLSGTSLASNVANSSLTSVGTITSGTWSGTVIGSNYGGAGSVTGLMKANGSGVVSAAIAGTDYQSPITAASATGQYLTSAAGGTYTWTSASASTGVPYAGASGPVDLGAYDLKVNGLTIGRSIGSNNALNIAIGRNALQSVTTSNQSIGIGYNALQKLTTGYGNTSIGSGALPVITSGGDNVGIGMASLYNSLTPSYNVGVGNESLYGSNGNYNTGIGYKALKMSTIVANNIGTNNIGVGYQTLSTLTSGKYNTVIGNNGGTGLTTGNYNTILGVQTANLSEALSNNIIISDGQGNVRAQHNGTTGWTLGTITSGTWSGTAIAIDKGGTGLSSPGTSGNVLTSNGTGWTSSAPAAVDAGTLTGTSLASTITGSNLTSLGTITSGTWNGTAIAIDKGGTGLSSPGTSGNVLTSNGTGWTSSAPAAVDAGTLTGTSLASTITGSNLTSLGTISSGTWSGTAIAVDKGGTGATTKTAAFDGLSPMTTSGDIIYGGTSGTGTRLGKGTDGQVLTLVSGLPTWSTAAASSGGGLSSIGAISGTSTPKGATINGTTELILTPADTTNGGVVTTGAQIFAGVKTFSPTVTATANNQILSGLDINPTFNNSTFTGVNNYGLRVQGVGIGTGGGNMPDNTAIGKSALYANSTGVKNTGIGVDALKLNRTGFNNTAIGYQAASGQGSPSYVTAIGSGALSVSTGSDNTAIGAFALHRNTSGINNTVVGTSALSFNRTGNNNVVMGHQALVASSLNSSDDNTAIGFKSMYNNMTGGTNTIIGSLSGFNNTTGAGNANYGYKSLYNNQAGSDNVALGNNSGSLAGSSTGVSLTSSNQSIFIGSGTRAGTNTSTNEVVIGYGAVGNGSNTTTIGNSSTTQTYLPSGLTMGNSLGSVDATLTLHPNSTSAQGGSEGGQLNFKKSVSTSAYDWFIDQYADGNGARLRILPGRTSPESYGLAISEDGNMGIGSIPNASYKLHVAGDINATGSVRASGVALSSDFRLKTNISSLNSAMKTLNLLSPVSYDKKVSLADSVYSKQELGFIAQEVQKVLPQLVTEGKDKDRLLSLDYISIIPLLTKAMQEQDVVIKDAQKENTTLKKQLEEQKKRLDAIEQLVQKLSTNLK